MVGTEKLLHTHTPRRPECLSLPHSSPFTQIGFVTNSLFLGVTQFGSTAVCSQIANAFVSHPPFSVCDPWKYTRHALPFPSNTGDTCNRWEPSPALQRVKNARLSLDKKLVHPDKWLTLLFMQPPPFHGNTSQKVCPKPSNYLSSPAWVLKWVFIKAVGRQWMRATHT